MGSALSCSGTILEPAGIGSLGHGGSFQHLTEATTAAPLYQNLAMQFQYKHSAQQKLLILLVVLATSIKMTHGNKRKQVNNLLKNTNFQKVIHGISSSFFHFLYLSANWTHGGKISLPCLVSGTVYNCQLIVLNDTSTWCISYSNKKQNTRWSSWKCLECVRRVWEGLMY